MDCFRSALEGVVEAVPVPGPLDGLAAGAGEVPKKSNPSRDSAGFVCFAGAGAAFGGGLEPRGGPVLGLAGALKSSPKRSMLTLAAWRAGAAWRCDDDRSMDAAAGVAATG